MKCANCNIEIKKEFKFAISSNKCPACAKPILNTNNMSSFVPLCELLSSKLGNENVENIEEIVTLIITSFNVNPKSATPISGIERKDNVEVSEDVIEEIITEDGVKLETYDKKKSKEALQKMRDDVLNGAINDRYGVSMDEEVIMSENPKANAELLKQRQKQLEAQEKVSAGLGGGFRRG